MSDQVLRIENVSKEYQKVTALDHVSISMEKGRIYGFVGQNGAGKTTLMRIITGLSFPTSGEIEIFGQSGQRGLEKARRRLGSLVESVSMYPNLTASQNLEFHRSLKGVKDPGAIAAVLKMVGLEKTGDKKFKDFSMGMKQRLGIGAALLGRPELLILDEPINGLDPKGIVEIRQLLSELNRSHGTTILISSHILSELYMLATDYIVIDEGRIVDVLTAEQLSDQCQKQVTIQSDRIGDVEYVLQEQLHIVDYQIKSNDRITFSDPLYDRKALAETFYEKGILLTELSYRDESLESYFMNAIGRRSNESTIHKSV